MSPSDGSLSDRIRALSPEKRRALEQALAARRTQAVENTPSEDLATPPPSGLGATAVLSSAQRRMWFLDRRDPEHSAYNVPIAVRLKGAVDPTLVRRSLASVMERHVVLRTRYEERDGEVVAVVDPLSDPEWRVIDLSAQDLEAALRSVDDMAAADGLAPVDLTVHVLRTTLYKIAADDWVLHLVAHHIAVDGWSTEILLSEIEQTYQAFAAELEPALPPLKAQYADYAREEVQTLSSDRVKAATAFWQRALSDAPDGVNLPVTADMGAKVAEVGTLPFGIDEPDYSAFKTFCRSQRISVFVGFLALLKLVLARYTRNADMVVGTEASVRTRAEYSDLIGLFVNQLALRTDLSGDPSFAEACRRVAAVTRAAFAHQDLPFDRVVRALRRQGERQPLFNTVLSLRTAEPARASLGTSTSVRFEMLPDGGPKTFAPKFDLVFSIVDDGSRLGGAIEFDQRLFSADAMAGLADALHAVVGLGLAEPDRPLGRIAIGGPRLEALERGAWNATERQLPPVVGLHRFFEAAHDRNPEHPALSHGDVVWTHARLEREANALAGQILDTGGGSERVVACCLARGPNLIVAVLAVLKAGAGILVLDPFFASHREQGILEDANPAVVLVDATALDRFSGKHWPVLTVGGAGAPPVGAPVRPNVPIDPDQIAYVIYTSGSTGRPKGVVGHHRGLTALSEAQVAAFGLGPDDRVMQFSAITFDAFIWELALVWRAGAVLVMHPDGAPQPDAEFLSLLQEQRVSMLTIPPSVLGALPDGDLSDLRTLVVAGEACPAALTDRFAEGRSMTNAYGPTETTVWASGERCRAGEAPPIGQPVANMHLHLVDDSMNPVPIGALGEIALAGPQVTRGYLGQPGLTADRFRPNPFSPDPGARMYLTGDVGTRLPDGRVRYIGRADEQVKIRGFRVEPGEAQGVLARHPGVGQVVVRALAHDGRTHLVAWWVPGGGGCDDAALRAFAAEHLPSYLRPTFYVRVDEMPLTPHGKIDRKALPAPLWSGVSAAVGGAPPRPGIESRLAAVWAQVLKLERVHRDDNFFELGGDSILSVQVVSRARTAGLAFTSVQLFAHPTIAGLSPLIDQVTPAHRREDVASALDLPLSPLQEGLLFHCLRRPDLPLYVQHFQLKIDGPLDVDALERAWSRVLRRHESLRTVFLWRGREVPIQRVQPDVELRIRREDLSAMAPADAKTALDRIRQTERETGFDLAEAPLLRCTVVRLAEARWDLLWSCHHLLVDGWSFAVIERDLFALYAAETGGGQASEDLPSSAAPFRDYLDWITRQDGEAARRWWAGRLSGFDTPMRLADAAGTAEVRASEDRWGEVSECLDPDADLRLRSFAAARGLTLNTVVQAAWALVVARHLRRRDVLYGMVVSGRPADLSGVEDIVGLFINTLPCRVPVDPARPASDFLKSVQVEIAEMQARAFLSLAELQRLSDVPAGVAPFDALLVVQALPAGGEMPGELTIAAEPVSARTDYPLTVIVEVAGQTALRFIHDRSILGGARTQALAKALRAALEALPEAAERPVGAWAALAEDERLRVISQFGSGPTPLEHVALVDLVAARAAERPDASALVLEGRTRTYGELEANANRLANWLRAEGIGPERVVALYMHRSFELVEAMLAVMKAGGAFLPLGTEVPRPRLAQMLEDADPALILSGTGLADGLPEAARRVVCVDGSEKPWAACGAEPPAPLGGPDSAVYIFYTSGSTGRPKGVLNTRRGLENRVLWGQRAYPLTSSDRVMQKTPYNFDVSVWEWLWPLTVGATLVIARPDGHRSPAYLAELAERENVTVMHFVPSMLQVFLEDPRLPKRARALRRIVCSGEAVSGDLRDRCRSLAGVEILNLYGPTEAAIEVSHWLCAEGQTGPAVPMGHPIDGVTLRVVDPDGHPCPVGVAGELLIGGIAVARGYVGRPGQTAERFRPDPVAAEPGARVYYTGDLAMWRPDGGLDYLGRIDWQVKIRGQRVELGEIEATLRGIDSIRDAVVIWRKTGDGDGRLIAYIVGEAAIEAVKSHVGETLPAVMQPGDYIPLDGLPLTASGKLDRGALPDRAGSIATVGGKGGAPTDSLSRDLADVFADVLGIGAESMSAPDRSIIGIDDHFSADLGGHSLQVLRVVGRIDKRWPGRVSLADFLRGPTVGEIARRLRGESDVDTSSVSPLLVRLRPGVPGETEPPIFLVHPALGAVICYIHMSGSFPGTRPIIGIQAPELAGCSPGDDLCELAQRYRAAARTVQPKGPLSIAGYSYGGLVAFEMARQEEQAGTCPDALAVLDTLAPPEAPSGDAGPGEAALLAELGSVLERYAGGTSTLRVEDLLEVPESDRIDHVRRHLESRGVLDGLAKALDLEATLSATRGAGRARAFYRPGAYGGSMALLRCAAPSAEDRFGVPASVLDDPALGWQRWVSGSITVETVPGDHVDLLRGQNGGFVARWLDAQMRPSGSAAD